MSMPMPMDREIEDGMILAASINSMDGNVGSASEDEANRSLKKLRVNETNFREDGGPEDADAQAFEDLERLVQAGNLSSEERQQLEEHIHLYQQMKRAQEAKIMQMSENSKQNEGNEPTEQARGANEDQARRPEDSAVLPSDYEDPHTDLEGNETENEVIRDHLDQLEEIG